MKRKVIKFWPKSNDLAEVLLPPIPTKKTVPSWYKETPKFFGNNENKIEIYDNGSVNASFKTCMSFFDMFNMGYIYRLHCDILVTKNNLNNGILDLSWTSPISPLTPRPVESVHHLPKLSGYTLFNQAWELQYSFQTPPGYSVMLTQPFNRADLPTYVTSGIIDSEIALPPGGIPFAIKNDFEGIIPSGTPIVQIIPFKRESWDHVFIDVPYSKNYAGVARNKIVGWYRQNMWHKKDFR